MNLSDGVSFKNMRDGNLIWKTYRANPSGEWVTKLPTHLQPHASDVVDAVLGSGAGGRYSAAELGSRTRNTHGPGGWLAAMAGNGN